MEELNRTLEVFADGERVVGYGRAWLSGREELNLFPAPFMLRLWNLEESDYLLLSRAREVSVSHEGSVLAAGRIADVFRRTAPEGTVTCVCFSPGLPLWEAAVSLSVEAGVSVSETIQGILEASGTGIRLLGWTGENPVFSRGQAFLGRASECIEEALGAASARACLTPSGLCVVPEEGLPVSLALTEADLIDAPAFPSGRLMVLRTKAVGWAAGKSVSVSWKGIRAEGLMVSRAVEADTGSGPWQGEMIVEMRL